MKGTAPDIWRYINAFIIIIIIIISGQLIINAKFVIIMSVIYMDSKTMNSNSYNLKLLNPLRS